MNRDEIVEFQGTLSLLCKKIYSMVGGYGPESLYQNALVKELSLSYPDYNIYREVPVPIKYCEDVVAERRIDIALYKESDRDVPVVILEIKWVSNNSLRPWQLYNYMSSTSCRYGFLINFEKMGSYPIVDEYTLPSMYDIEYNKEDERIPYSYNYSSDNEKDKDVRIIRLGSIS
jgi:GxxExxY protein